MMDKEFPMCCTARIICDFGGTLTSAGDTGPTDEAELRKWIKGRMKYKSRGTVMVGITNSSQKIANKILLELGFSHSKWMSKAQHRGTKMRLWWKQTGVK